MGTDLNNNTVIVLYLESSNSFSDEPFDAAGGDIPRKAAIDGETSTG